MRASTALFPLQMALVAALMFSSAMPAAASVTATDTAGIVAAPRPDVTAEPSLMVGAVRTSPAVLTPGSRFELRLTVKNVGRHSAHMAVLSVGSGVSAATGQASPFVALGHGAVTLVGDIAANGSKRVVVPMIAGPKGEPGAYALPVTIECTVDGVRRVADTSIGLVLSREGSFSITGLPDSIRTRVGEAAPLKISAVNSGSFAVNGVSMSVVSTGATVTDGYQFVGLLEAGDGDLVETELQFAKPGSYRVRFNVAYTDDFFRRRVVSWDTTAVVGARVSSAPPTDQSQDSGFNRFLKFLAGLLGLG